MLVGFCRAFERISEILSMRNMLSLLISLFKGSLFKPRFLASKKRNHFRELTKMVIRRRFVSQMREFKTWPRGRIFVHVHSSRRFVSAHDRTEGKTTSEMAYFVYFAYNVLVFGQGG